MVVVERLTTYPATILRNLGIDLRWAENVDHDGRH